MADEVNHSAAGEPAGTAPAHIVVLRDLREVLVRPLHVGDRDALAAGFRRLSSESQRARFGSAPHVLRGAALRHLVDSVDGVDHVAFVAFPTNDPETLVGVGRILRYPDDPASLDIGMTIADDYQGVGLGTALAGLLARYRPRPARRISTQITHGNRGAVSLLRTFGPLRTTRDGRTVIDFEEAD